MLLLVNATGALTAGFLFMTDPSGKSMGLTTELLRYSPFSNFFIPGLVLFISNGVLSMITAIMTLMNYNKAYTYVFFQGCILAGWLFVQMIMLQMIHLLHIVMGAAAILLIYIGFMELNKKRA